MTVSIKFLGKLILSLINKENTTPQKCTYTTKITQPGDNESLSKDLMEANNNVVNRKTQVKA